MPLDPRDQQWIDRLREGSPQRDEAIAELRDILVRGLARSMNNRYGSRFQAEDVVQLALLKILDSLDQFAGRSRFTTWAMAIATRVGISQHRRKHFQDVSLDAITSSDALKFDVADEGAPTAQQNQDRQFVLGKLQELIDSQLTEKQHVAIRGLLEGLPVEEIAHRTGSNRNAVYKLVHDARVRLRDAFHHAGIAQEDIDAILA